MGGLFLLGKNWEEYGPKKDGRANWPEGGGKLKGLGLCDFLRGGLSKPTSHFKGNLEGVMEPHFFKQ